MSNAGPVRSKRLRGKYSRLICIGCRNRRIRCELPSEVEIPDPGEFRTVQTPCYRCKKLGIPCIVRQTILGRPGHEASSTAGTSFEPIRTGEIVSRIEIELPLQTAENRQIYTVQSDAEASGRFALVSRTRVGDTTHCSGCTPLIHTPKSTETVIILRAADTLRREKVEKEWFRHLPAYVGHTLALDLSIKALVAACAYARGVPKLTSGDCHQALALALNAVQASIKQSSGELNDEILASTALLAPFEGVMKKQGIPTRLHVEGMAAILAGRQAAYAITPLARDIFDFYACDSAIMACIQGTPSPFENVARGYYADDWTGFVASDRNRIKALGSELFVRIPRLVGLIRCLRSRLSPQLLLAAWTLLQSLLQLQDLEAEERLLRQIDRQAPTNSPALLFPFGSFCFSSVEDFEAIAYYWQNRLCLLRLERYLHDLSLSLTERIRNADEQEMLFQPTYGPRLNNNELSQLTMNILMCAEYVGTLPLRKHQHLYVYAMALLWGVVKDVPNALSYTADIKWKQNLLAFLLHRTTAALESKTDLSIEDLDAAADLFVGGKPQGKFSELYSL